jgi:peptidase M28-like protein
LAVLAAVLGAGHGAGLTLGCSAAALPSAAPAAPRVEEPAPPPPLRPLTRDEAQLRAELEAEHGELAELGPRSLAHSWNLHSATDHLARKLERMGYEVHRQGFPVGEEVLQNLEVVVPGSKTPAALVIAAHYDTTAESLGANASASGAIALLSVARALVGKHFARGVRLVWLSNESGGPGTPGSAVYVAHARHERAPILATLTLGSLGNYSLENGSQRYPDEILYGAEHRSHFGNFVALLSNAGSDALLDAARPALSTASLPVEELVLPEQAPLAGEGAQARFWQAGLAGLVLTDTAQFRSPFPQGPADTLDKLDFDRLTRVTRLIEALISTLADAPSGSAAPELDPSAPPPAASAPGELLPELPPPVTAPGRAPAPPG